MVVDPIQPHPRERGFSVWSSLLGLALGLLSASLWFALNRSSSSSVEEATEVTESRFQLDAKPQAQPEGSVIQDGPSAPVRLSSRSLDFGLQPVKQQAYGTLDLTNEGESPLDLMAISPTCGCLSTDFAGRTQLAPGESMTLTVYHEIRDMPSSTKEALRFVFLGHKILTVPVSVEFTRPIKSDPTFLDADAQDSGSFTLRSLDDQPFRVLSLLGGDLKAAEGFDLSKPSSVHRIEWNLTAYDKELCRALSGEPFPKWIVVETDHPDAPLIDIRVRQYPCTMLDLPMKEPRSWYLNTHRVVLGQLAPGESTEVAVPVEYLKGATVPDPLELDVSKLTDLEVSIASYPGRNRVGSTTINLSITKKINAAPGLSMELLQVRGLDSDLDQEIQLFHSYRPED